MILFAVLPVAVILVLMLGLGWSAARAGAAGLTIAAVVGVGAFGFPGALPVGATAAALGWQPRPGSSP